MTPRSLHRLLPALLIAGPALLAGAAAWVVQQGPEPARTLRGPRATASAPIARPETVIRLRPAALPATSCARLRYARPTPAILGGAASADAASYAASSLPLAEDGLAYTRSAVEDWPGQAGGDAGRP